MGYPGSVMASSAELELPSGRRAQETYRTLVRWTRRVISETGGFSGELVAERSGMSPATFYTYFASKDAALAAALDEVLGELVDGTLRELRIERLLEDGLRRVVERAVAAAVGVFRESAIVMRLALARLPESPAIRHVYRDHQARAVEELRRFVRLGVSASRLSAESIEATTSALLVTLQGLNNPMLLRGGRPDPAVKRMVDMIVHLLDPRGLSARA